jgi:hypothetical protein
MFKNNAQKKAFENVGKYLEQSFGKGLVRRPDAPCYVGTQGSCLVEVWVYARGSNGAVVNVRSCCVMDMGEIPADCLKFLLEENFKFTFGAFSLDRDGDINFEHTLLATKLDREELEASVKAVLTTADEYDDRIIRDWGGVTAREKLLRQAREAGLVA